MERHGNPIDDMARVAGEPLVTRIVGGRGGDHTMLTSRGEAFLDKVSRVQREHTHFLERLNHAVSD